MLADPAWGRVAFSSARCSSARCSSGRCRSARCRRAGNAAVLALAGVLVLAACDMRPAPEVEPPSNDSRLDDSPPTTPDTGFQSTLSGPGHRTDGRTDDSARDVGVGFLRITPDLAGPPGTAAPDTIEIRSAPRRGAPLVARAFQREYRLVVEALESGLRDGALEVGYEERALPVLEERDRSDGDGRWVRVSFASGEGEEPHTGWANSRGPGVEYIRRGDWLADAEARGPLHFLDPDSIAFFDEPGGARVYLPLVPRAGSPGYDYALHPLRTDGSWMEVRVVSPSDFCHPSRDPAASEVNERRWIRFLDSEGRPPVWYYTRGC